MLVNSLASYQTRTTLHPMWQMSLLCAHECSSRSVAMSNLQSSSVKMKRTCYFWFQTAVIHLSRPQTPLWYYKWFVLFIQDSHSNRQVLSSFYFDWLWNSRFSRVLSCWNWSLFLLVMHCWFEELKHLFWAICQKWNTSKHTPLLLALFYRLAFCRLVPRNLHPTRKIEFQSRILVFYGCQLVSVGYIR